MLAQPPTLNYLSFVYANISTWSADLVDGLEHGSCTRERRRRGINPFRRVRGCIGTFDWRMLGDRRAYVLCRSRSRTLRPVAGAVNRSPGNVRAWLG